MDKKWSEFSIGYCLPGIYGLNTTIESKKDWIELVRILIETLNHLDLGKYNQEEMIEELKEMKLDRERKCFSTEQDKSDKERVLSLGFWAQKQGIDLSI